MPIRMSMEPLYQRFESKAVSKNGAGLAGHVSHNYNRVGERSNEQAT